MSNYVVQFEGDCAANGSVNITPSVTKTCVIRNSGFPTVTIAFIGDSQFNVQFDGNNEATGVHQFSETKSLKSLSSASHRIGITPSGTTNLQDYQVIFGGDCQAAAGGANATLSISAGDAKSCNIRAVAVTCPTGQKQCGRRASGFPDLCVPEQGTCDALCPSVPRQHRFGTFCGVNPDNGQAECGYPPRGC